MRDLAETLLALVLFALSPWGLPITLLVVLAVAGWCR